MPDKPAQTPSSANYRERNSPVSELTQCNYCTLRGIKRDAKREGKRVLLRSSTFMGGTNVFVVPRNIDLPKQINDKDADGHTFHKYKVAWLRTVTPTCVC